ncbi:MAG: MarR family transcriptional regulator [Bacillota bacterium]|nr:MarR family transcriptional regulator [Bacillota bacterium]
MTREQWMILGKLFEQDGINQKELADQLLKEQSALTRTLDRMERDGYIKREVSPNDRRAFLVYLTDAGITLRNQIEPIAIACLEQAVKGFNEEEVNILKNLLNRTVLNLK